MLEARALVAHFTNEGDLGTLCALACPASRVKVAAPVHIEQVLLFAFATNVRSPESAVIAVSINTGCIYAKIVADVMPEALFARFTQGRTEIALVTI